jgi:hypothetical protein
MDDFEKLAKLVGAPVEAAQYAGLPQSAAEAKALGSRWYFTGKPCKHGHTEKRTTTTRRCHRCQLLRNATPEAKETQRRYRAKPEAKETQRRHNTKPETKEAKRLRNYQPNTKEAQRRYDTKPETKEAKRLRNRQLKAKEAKRLRNMEKTGDVLLFAINQAEWAATRKRAYADIATQCPEPQRSQLQGLIDRIRADPKAGKAVIALLRTMRELRKTELAEAKNEAR